MKEKVVEFGTKYKVVVDSVSKNAIIVIAEDIKEGFVLLGHGMKELPKVGDSGTIVFERGGIKGGYWKYYPA